MIISFTNVIGAIRSLGEAAQVITTNLKMWLGFETSETLGSEEVVNGDFSNGLNDWSYSTGWGFNANTAVYDGTGSAFSKLIQTLSTVDGRNYQMTFTLSGLSSGDDVNFGLGVEGVEWNPALYPQKTYNSDGTYTVVMQANSPINAIIIQANQADANFAVSNVSVKKLTQFTPDKSGNNNVGDLFTGKALEFDGSTTYVTADGFAGTLSNNTAFTIVMWFKSNKEQPDAAAYKNNLMSGTEDDEDTNIFKFSVSSSNNSTIKGIYYNDTPGQHIKVNNTVNYNDNVWHRLVISRGQGTGYQDAYFYVDGVNIGDCPSRIYWDDLATFSIGQEYDNGNVSDVFKGLISDVQIYNKNWIQADVTYDYANPNKLAIDNPSTDLVVTNLVGYWAMSEGDGLVAYDSGSNLEEEEVVDGDFPLPNNNWTLEAGWSINNGKATYNGSTANNLIRQTLNITIGATYKLQFTVEDYVSGTLNTALSDGSLGSNSIAANGTYSFYIIATGILCSFRSTDRFDGSISNVSVREVTASDHGGILNGATYVDAQPRIPQLGMMNWSKGSNLLTYSEDFSQSVWIKNNLNQTYGFTSPTGLLNATKLIRTSTNSYIESTINITTVQYNTASIYVKGVSNTIGEDVRLYVYNGTGSGNEAFTLTGDWQRITHTHSSASGKSSMKIKLDIPNITNGEVLVWGGQLEQSSSASAYRLTDGGTTSNSTVIANPTIPTKDIFGNAVRDRLNSFNLDGIGYAEVADDTDLDIGTGAFTMECWVKADFEFKGSSINVILSLGGSGSGSGSAALVSHSTNKLGGYVNGSTLDADSVFTIGDWYHVAITRNGSGLCTLYVDSVAQTDTETNQGNITNSDAKLIGRDTETARFYQNLISDVRLYKGKALTSDEVENNYNAGLSAHTN